MGIPSGRRWQALAFLVAAGLVVALEAVLLLRVLLARDDTPAGGQDTSALSFNPPVVLPANGSYVVSVVLPSGDLKVTHWINSKSPLFSIKLAAPELDAAGSGPVTAKDVLVAGDGRVVYGAYSVDKIGQSYPFYGVNSIYVTYVLSGVIERSASEEGRALARVTSLDVSYDSLRGASTRSVRGAEVLSMACSPPSTPTAVPVPCGAPGDDGWQVELRGDARADRVMAQLELD